MVSRLDALLNFHAAALSVRTRRQELLAANIANADVPSYKARDIDFAQALSQALSTATPTGALATTGGRHLAGNGAVSPIGEPLYRIPLQNSVDGNTVELDVERSMFADNALHIEANLTFLNAQIKTMLAALQG